MKTFLHVGTNDLCLSSFGKIYFRIQINSIAQHLPPDPVFLHSVTDMISIAFFFLLCLCEYTHAPFNMSPFRSMYVQLSICDRHLIITICSSAELSQARFVSLTSWTRRMGVRHEVSGLAHTGDLYLFPLLALTRCITHLRVNSASPNTPLV